MKEHEGVCWQCGREGHMAKNCVANMPDDVKCKVIDHVHIASTSPDEELFAFASANADDAHNNPFCESVMYGSRKQGKCKCREEFAW
jgi:Zinc knuckle